MSNAIEIYKGIINNFNEIRIILFYKEPINGKDTIIFPYPTIKFEHPKLIKPFLKEQGLLKKLDKSLIKGDIFEISWALAKIGIATFVNVTPSSEHVDYAFITIPKRVSKTQIDAIDRLNCVIEEYQKVECAKILNDNSIFPIDEINNGKELIDYINKEKVFVKRKG